MALAEKDVQRLQTRLETERNAIIERSRTRASEALQEPTCLPDAADIASAGQEQAVELRLADKDRKLLHLIEHALEKIPRGEYGLCEGTGDPIEPARLDARPWARFSVAHKEKLERERSLFDR